MMYCQGCGHQMHEEARACPSCGKPNAALAVNNEQDGGYFSFRGRISRKVYWLHYFLPITVCNILVGVVDGAIEANGILLGLVTLIFLVPQLAAGVKRLHDKDHSGWMILIALIPVFGGLWYFIVTGLLRGTIGPNRFGADPIADRRPRVAAAGAY